MLWDPSFDAWSHFGVRANSDMRVVDANGQSLSENLYLMNAENADAILELVASL